MEQQTLLPKNKTTTKLIVTAVIVVGIVIFIINKSSSILEGEPTVNTVPATEDAVSANALETISAGRGDLAFVLSAKQDSIVREIQLYNPLKDSWVMVYDGYKSVGLTPTEVFRASVAAITYSKVQVRTLDNFFSFDRPIIAHSGAVDIVTLSLE